jgi:hypothetical protein
MEPIYGPPAPETYVTGAVIRWTTAIFAAR